MSLRWSASYACRAHRSLTMLCREWSPRCMQCGARQKRWTTHPATLRRPLPLRRKRPQVARTLLGTSQRRKRSGPELHRPIDLQAALVSLQRASNRRSGRPQPAVEPTNTPIGGVSAHHFTFFGTAGVVDGGAKKRFVLLNAAKKVKNGREWASKRARSTGPRMLDRRLLSAYRSHPVVLQRKEWHAAAGASRAA